MGSVHQPVARAPRHRIRHAAVARGVTPLPCLNVVTAMASDPLVRRAPTREPAPFDHKRIFFCYDAIWTQKKDLFSIYPALCGIGCFGWPHRGISRRRVRRGRRPGPAQIVSDRHAKRDGRRSVAAPGTLRVNYPATDAVARVGSRAMSRPAFASATRMSYALCGLSQNCALMPNQWPRRSDVSAVTPRRPWMICVTRLGGTLIWRESSVGVTPSSFSSSARISPGWMAGRGMLRRRRPRPSSRAPE